MTVPKSVRQDKPELNEWVLLEGYRGSISHGTYMPGKDTIDDKDIMTIIVPPLEYYFGLSKFGSKGTKEIKIDEWDIVIYEFLKFVYLLEKGNPNVLAMLWLEPNYYTKITDGGKYLIDNRHLFVGKHVYRSFSGYAYGQLKRMTRGNDNSAYQGEKRRKLFEKFGYDCKNAAHLIRLLRMGIEFLTDGQLYVHRHDAPQLIQIKQGEWSLEQVNNEADKLFERAELAYINSTLPLEPNRDEINNLCINIIGNSSSFSLLDFIRMKDR